MFTPRPEAKKSDIRKGKAHEAFSSPEPKETTKFCPSGLTQSSSMVHARNGCSQSSRFLSQARRIVGSGDENAHEVVAHHTAVK